MIFVTVGTERFPFDRMIKVLDDAAGSGTIKHEIFAQTGSSRYRPKNFESQNLISFNLMIEKIKSAQIVVSHAGVGSVILCLSLGKIPVIFPRRRRFGEHLDDHQVEFAGKMDELNRLIVAYDENELIDKIGNYRQLAQNFAAADSASKHKLISFLRHSLINQK